ncbi:MAG TPA: LssY C-terminal domain-containing protein [Candidatus Acidoferrales bacterium]|nr:LssY C-terminal domain-containing protein [Candidatus Acidoferrales bacterium]
MASRWLAVGLAALLLVGSASAEAPKGRKERVSLEELLRKMPTRVQDKDGHQGDMVNFVLVGSREQVQKTLAAAGWQEVDRNSTEAAIRAILITLEKKVYVTMPMSELFLFGRAQDFGYAQADPIRVVAERHHFRLWETPWQTEDGQDIWLGAGTFDAGFEEHKRTGDITHKIDPEVDKERDHIAGTLRQAGRVAGIGYGRPSQPIREATTAHGGEYRSDGRLAIILLK